MDVILRVRRSVSGRVEKSMGMTVDFGIDGFEGDVLGKVTKLGVGYGR